MSLRCNYILPSPLSPRNTGPSRDPRLAWHFDSELAVLVAEPGYRVAIQLGQSLGEVDGGNYAPSINAL